MGGHRTTNYSTFKLASRVCLARKIKQRVNGCETKKRIHRSNKNTQIAVVGKKSNYLRTNYRDRLLSEFRINERSKLPLVRRNIGRIQKSIGGTRAAIR